MGVKFNILKTIKQKLPETRQLKVFLSRIQKTAIKIFTAVKNPFIKAGKAINEKPYLAFMKKGSAARYILSRTIWLFIFAFLTYVFCLAKEPIKFYGDSSGYWSMSKLFKINGVFAFENCQSGARGYLMSFIIYLFINLGSVFKLNDVHSYYLGFSLLTGTVMSFVLPSLFNRIFKTKAPVWSSIIFYLVVVFFWGGDMAYPLTDLMAMFAALITAVAFFYLNEKRLNLFSSLF